LSRAVVVGISATRWTPNFGDLSRTEAELRGLKAMVDELRQARDAWQAQAERATLALAGPKLEPERRPWWRRLVG
jgi:hypothetical protein